VARDSAKLGRATRRIGVAVVAALAGATALTGGASPARSQDVVGVQAPLVSASALRLPLPQVTTPEVSVPVTAPNVGPLPATPVTPPVTVPPPAPPPVTVPKVTTPPSVEVPVPKPALPRVEIGPSPSAPSAGGSGGGGGGRLPSLPLLGGGDSPTAGSSPLAGAGLPLAGTGVPLAAGSALLEAPAAGRASGQAGAQLGLPSRRELAAASPAQRRRILRRVFDEPARGDRLRRLRETLLDNQGCLGALPDRGRRALIMRAGLFGRQPASRRTIARRLGITLARELRLEVTTLRRLTSAGERGLCGGQGWMATAFPIVDSLTTSGEAAGDAVDAAPTATARAADTGNEGEPSGAVRGDTREGGLVLDLDEGFGDAAPEALFLLMLLALGLIAAGALAARALAREVASPPPAGAAAVPPGERPLLFLDVDGVIALNGWSLEPPPGKLHVIDVGAVYVADRAGELVRRLATRFDLVWATGWEKHANRELQGILGLEKGLPVLSFGRSARFGSSTWKIDPVDRYARDRPAAWIDDNFEWEHERWAANRPAPTVLIAADPDEGLCEGHVERLIAWADSLVPAEDAASGANGGRRANGRRAAAANGKR
jgi:HAD domain in Swiss Army Knife RNA repair proteins